MSTPLSAAHAARAHAFFETEIEGPADTDEIDVAVAEALRGIADGVEGSVLTPAQARHAAGFARAYGDDEVLTALEAIAAEGAD